MNQQMETTKRETGGVSEHVIVQNRLTLQSKNTGTEIK